MTNKTRIIKNGAKINVSLPESDLKKFDRIAEKRRLSRSALVREAMLAYVRNDNGGTRQ